MKYRVVALKDKYSVQRRLLPFIWKEEDHFNRLENAQKNARDRMNNYINRKKGIGGYKTGEVVSIHDRKELLAAKLSGKMEESGS